MPVVVLKEEGGERVLPIWIGPREASAIAVELAAKKLSRSLTHDLLVSVLESLDGELERVIIGPLDGNLFLAEMIMRRHGEVVSIDARPSDSIAVALRMEAEIFVHDDLLGSDSVELAEDQPATENDVRAEEADTSASTE
jgi:bifunctional DNase/RNase